jgi:hypothetical protein
MLLTIITFDDLEGQQLRMELPHVRLGDKVSLKAQLTRRHQGRTEVLTLGGDFKVMSVSLDGSRKVVHQLIRVGCIGVVPAWRAVKNPPEGKPFCPARFPRTTID